METIEGSARVRAKDECGDRLRRMWALSVLVVLAWREGKGRTCGHRVSFLIFRVLAMGREKEHRKSPGLHRVSAAPSHDSVPLKTSGQMSPEDVRYRQ